MPQILIFGNSGAGKSTLAKKLATEHSVGHFDLDEIAWMAQTPPMRKPIEHSLTDLAPFLKQNADWVIEGCYGDLIQALVPYASELVFLDLSVADCQENARMRPWEPHKYPSKEAQDANLSMLLDWIAGYDERDDVLSRSYHNDLFEQFTGPKRRILTRNDL